MVTGAGREIGTAIASRLAQAGIAVVLTARTADRIEALAVALRASGLQAFAVACDVSLHNPVEAAVGLAIDAFGRLDSSTDMMT